MDAPVTHEKTIAYYQQDQPIPAQRVVQSATVSECRAFQHQWPGRECWHDFVRTHPVGTRQSCERGCGTAREVVAG